MKTLAIAQHESGPAENGHDGCHARIGYRGMCPGIQTAAWLNSLGDDDSPYMTIKGAVVTNGDVRRNWFNSSNHVLPADAVLFRLRQRRSELKRDLAIVSRDLRRLERSRK